MEDFNRYLDQIKAEKELKEKTKLFLQKKLSAMDSADNKIEKRGIIMKNQIFDNINNNKPDHMMKRVFIAASAFIVVAAVSIAGYVFYKTPVNYVSLDINPSVELTLNAFDRVIGVEATNADGETLMLEEHVRNLSVEKAINQLVQNAYEKGFVNQDGSSVIAVTAESANNDKALQLQEKSANGVGLAMAEKNMFATVYKDCSDLMLRTEAKEQGISPGKYKLIKMLQTLDPTITMEQYQNAKVYEIINKANEIVQAQNTTGTQSKEVEEITSRVQSTVQEMNMNQEKATVQRQEQEQNRINNSGDSSGSGSQNQSQAQNQNQNQQGVSNVNSGSGSQNQTQSQVQSQTQSQVQSQTQSQVQSQVQSQQQTTSSQQTTSQTQSGATITPQQSGNTSQGQNGGTSQKGN